MSIPGGAPSLFLATAGAGAGFSIDRSLRFNSADSAYLNRTPSSAGNRKTWTWSEWVKRGDLSATSQHIFGNYYNSASYGFNVRFNSDTLNIFDITSGSTNVNLVTNRVFRDPSAWYHLVIVFDTTQSTSTDRLKLYVNGVQETSFSSATYPDQDTDYNINTTNLIAIGRGGSYAGQYFDGYLTEINFVDGSALDPTSFGELDDNNVWQPKDTASLTFGTNGFRLKFDDNSSNAALGTDSSGNGNNWSVNNLSVAAGAGNDSLVDTPTNGTQSDTGAGGEVVGNYATWNALSETGATLANGNLEATLTAAGAGKESVRGTLAVSSGKFYWEELLSDTGNQSGHYGVVAASTGPDIRLDTTSGTNAVLYAAWNGNKAVNGTVTSYGASFTTGDVIGVALNLDAGTITFYKNNSSQGSISLPTTGIAYTPTFAWSGAASAGTTKTNFGQRAFAYTAPSGFKALCTANLPDPTIADGSTAFDAKLWTGNGSTQNITGYNFSPDVVWTKQRNSAGFHALFDPIRGVYNAIRPSSSGGTYTDNGLLTAFNSDGFSIGSAGDINSNNNTYVGWAWDAGSSTATNTDGTISAQVRASPSAGISIVSYTGTGANATVGSGLNAKPGLILIKNRSVNGDWAVYHQSLGATKRLILNNTDAQLTQSVFMNDTEPTASVFSLGTSGNVNGSGNSLVAYCFAPVAGFSAFGSYTGNSNADGPFLYLNFTPKLVLLKRTNADSAWVMFDTERSPSNEIIDWLRPNGADGESTNNKFDIVSNGIKFRKADSFSNDSAGTFIYAAFAEHPFKTARAR